MTKCGDESLSIEELAVVYRIRISLYKVSQEIVNDTINDHFLLKIVIPQLIQDLQEIRVAIDSLHTDHVKNVLESWYTEIHDVFFQNEHVQAYIFNHLVAKDAWFDAS